MDNYQTFSCRLNEVEQSYLNEYWKNGFSSYVHDSIRRDIEMSKKNRKFNFLSDFSQQIVMLGLGAIFIFFSLTISGIVGFVLLFLFGVFFMLSSLFNIYTGLVKKWKMNS